MSYKLEYIWLDGYKPEASLRSKTKIVSSEPGSPSDCPEWSFDGSSTEQAAGDSSDCLLKPVRMVPDPARSARGEHHRVPDGLGVEPPRDGHDLTVTHISAPDGVKAMLLTRR